MTKAIVIAAGRGRRLMPYTDQMPKCLVPVDHRSILGIELDAFRAHGIDDVVIIRGYLGDVLSARAGELGGPVRFVDNPDWEHNNILESLFCAEREIDGPVFLTYSDIIFTPDVVAKLVAAPGDIGLIIDRAFRDVYVGRSDHPLPEAEVADLDERGLVKRVGKRALPPEDAFGEFIGLAKLSAVGAGWMRAAWRELVEEYRGREDQPFQRAPSFRAAYLTDMLQHLIDAGRPVHPVAIDGEWREIDTVQDLERARAMLGSTKETWR
ncbi:MAG TPA: phosphocholine cytidylyltransferase family protein [Kofleriaceae bacterium]|nr:phosphocholine cytidylyltransferase family protein [Kofleriaceae bacterium]